MSKCPQVEIAELKEEVERLTAEHDSLWERIHRLVADSLGPWGYGTWKDAAVSARMMLVVTTAERDELIELFRKLDNRGDPFDTFTQSVVREALDKHKEGK